MLKNFSILFFIMVLFTQSFGKTISIDNYYLKIEYNLSEGKFSIYDKVKNLVIVKNAYSAYIYNKKINVTSYIQDYIREYKIENINDKLGKGKKLSIYCEAKEYPSLITNFIIYHNFLIITNEIINTSNNKISIDKIFPLIVDYETAGGIFVGDNPMNCKILENGHNLFYDFEVRLINATQSSNSNWNACIYNLITFDTFLIGFLTVNKAFSYVFTKFLPEKSLIDNKRKGFTTLSTICSYEPSKRLNKNDILTSEMVYINFQEKEPLLGLENFAELIAKVNDIKIKDEIPTGWNSWGSYVHDINEDIILQNLECAVKYLKPYGLKYFQIDNGWQNNWGDWEVDKNKFPNGIKYVIDKIKEKGLKPGIWIAPFAVEKKSKLYQEHKEYFCKKTALARQMMSEDVEILDLSHPKAKEYIKKIFTKFKEWGIKWVKIDYIYYLLMGRDYYDKTKTQVEVFRDGLKLIKDTLGEDVFISAVGVTGPSYSLIDACRITLDNKPIWGDERHPTTQGIIPTMRTCIRRYYLNNKVWITHPDQVYLGTERMLKRWDTKEHYTLTEVKTWLTAVSLLGGVIKIGDSFCELNEDMLNMLRSVLPPKMYVARPIDLFTNYYPEIWYIEINDENKTFYYHIVGLFNWSKELKKDIILQFNKIGLNKNDTYLIYDFWQQEYLGEFKEGILTTLEPKQVKVLKIRKKEEKPHLLATNRHLLQEVVDFSNLKYENKVLKGKFNAVVGFNYKLVFYIPPEFKLKNIKVNNYKIEQEKIGNILNLQFLSIDNEIEFELVFH